MSCIRSCYDKGSPNFEHDDCSTCIHGDRPPQRTLVGQMKEGKDFTINKPWVGLSDEQITQVANSVYGETDVNSVELIRIDFARAIEAKLKEKNT